MKGRGTVVAAAVAIIEQQQVHLQDDEYSDDIYVMEPAVQKMLSGKCSAFARFSPDQMCGDFHDPARAPPGYFETRKHQNRASDAATATAMGEQLSGPGIVKNNHCFEWNAPDALATRRQHNHNHHGSPSSADAFDLGLSDLTNDKGSGQNCRGLDREVDFEAAVEDFDLTAIDVEKFVAKYNNNRDRGTVTSGDKVRGGGSEDGFSTTTDFSFKFSHLKEAEGDYETSPSTSESDSDFEGEHVVNGGLDTITEEERTSGISFNSSAGGQDSSSPEDDSTVKGNAPWSGTTSNRDSTSDLSSTSSENQPRGIVKDTSSSRCNKDFKWIRKNQSPSPSPKMEDQLPHTKPPINRLPPSRERTPRRSAEKSAPGSLDRRRRSHGKGEKEKERPRSTHILKSPPRLEDFYPSSGCQNWCCNPHATEPYCFKNFHRRHERFDPQKYGSNPMLMEQRCIDRGGSHPDLYGDCGKCRHDNFYDCCSYHTMSSCCMFGDRNFHWMPNYYPRKGPDQDEKLRKLQNEKDNLHLQVQVLNEQIEAQTEKISELEKSLSERKQQLLSTEDLLQREMLSRSSLETQKLELMSTISELKLQNAELEKDIMDLKSNFSNSGSITKPPLRPRISPQPQHSTPIYHGSNQALNFRSSPSPSPLINSLSNNSSLKTDGLSLQHDTQQPKFPFLLQTPPANFRRQIDVHYGSLPRQQFISNGQLEVDSNANPAGEVKKGVAFGRGFTSLLGGQARGHSVPNLAETQKIIIDDTIDNQPVSPTMQGNKTKGIKKIFGRVKRSGSGNLEDFPGAVEFQRGGVRATAAARLGWSEPQMSPKPDIPFSEWTTDNICDWLQDLGLDQYIPEAKKVIKNGQQLQEMSIHDIEKELNVKNPLHRKKLQLAIIDTQENNSSDPYLTKAGKLDTAWVLRWLDDTGLPQHKEAFLINRVDGRVLHRLTTDDLMLMHVTSMLHVSSLKRGIQVLRENNFEPGCLQRRSLPDDPPHPTSKMVCLWTSHRVMEWLRAVDLAEYAPNLRGAGVHGGLMVLETKFTSELLATLLNIPPGKTLLRRHLNTHFKELLGKDIIQAKREAEATLGYIPLTPSAKLKMAKKSQFSLKRKKSKGEVDYGDLVCPLNPNSQSGEHSESAISSLGGVS
ncbi:liprin-beta-2 isoform X2 [Agrilus planipennis]|uniref:Liprin-beta-2 isoform X2 n=1 Tax=Agrilus planipennis TaxID=224129 RepID=A0A1W4XII4_AGRPL|nr:liprin-beta-2 isoform X2 [Agrilus planipennis]